MFNYLGEQYKNQPQALAITCKKTSQYQDRKNENNKRTKSIDQPESTKEKGKKG